MTRLHLGFRNFKKEKEATDEQELIDSLKRELDEVRNIASISNYQANVERNRRIDLLNEVRAMRSLLDEIISKHDA